MNKKTFSASHWFQKNLEVTPESLLVREEDSQLPGQTPEDRFPSFKRVIKKACEFTQAPDKFSPLHCFVPGWKGDSLQSKSVVRFAQLMLQIQSDVKNDLFKTKDFPKTIKLGLYNEFLSYAETLGQHFDGLEDLTKFWNQITPENLESDSSLSEFIDIYTNRVATIIFLKLRFISHLSEKCQIELSDKALLYPTSFLNQIFRQGSIFELQSRALESNLYSWYHPHERMKDIMRELITISRELEISEITKNISLLTQVKQDQQKVYSHALSNLSFGLFINSLQINFPLWLEAIEGKMNYRSHLEEDKIVSCKYFGDYLESLSLSHWLAQENNINFHWEEILCPDFKGVEFVSGTFTKICNELQFLTFLTQKAEVQNEKPISYICKIISGHFHNRKNSQGKQGFLLDENPFFTSTYDRIVLNLCNFPKNNPQHYLMNQIHDQVKYLKPNSFLFVLSSKKLFVPSLRERLEPVLKDLKTEAIFDLENVKGKGELGSYIYVFRKKTRHEEEKQLCSYFRISADLENFQQFSSITEHLKSFYLSNLTEVPPMYHMEFPDTFRVEFFQEAVVNGMLIHSANEDSSRITHPSYFNALLANCVPLDTIFDIKSLSREKDLSLNQGLNLGLKRDTSYFLVVDFRTRDVSIELHPMDTFRSIHSDYGETLCSYFQLLPKLPGLNPNILRNYFLTPVGKQVTNLTFTGGPNLVKGSLSKFLVPKFLTMTEKLPDHLHSGFKILEMTEEELLDSRPKDILKAFIHIDQITKDIFPRYACEILSGLSNFERTLQTLLWKMDLSQKVSFNNPLLQAQLVSKPTKLLYPENDDIFIEFVEGTTPTDIHLTLTDTQLKVSHEGELKLYSLELIHQRKTVIRLHGEEALVLFVQFILAEAVNIPISALLRGVHVPSYKDLKEILELTKDFKQVYQELLTNVQNSIMFAMRLNVSPNRKS